MEQNKVHEQHPKIKFYKTAFENTSNERRQKFYDVAITEFAANGYNATNINVIAKKAGISIGSLYSYFDSKEDLFLTIVDKGSHLLEKALSHINTHEGDIFQVLEQLLRASRDYAINYPQLNQIYLDITTQGLSSLSYKLSYKLETITADTYLKVIQKAKENNLIDPNIDDRLVSFCIDNLIIMFQFSHTSDYYKERMKIFLGDDGLKDEEQIIEGILNFMRKAIL
ncbi:TetR/AcrR family transcriptional regulator [Chengkuizengella sediminis]|uniref:TetR/AcrR family transcriptional regulator n=1 Tax=Chengkuizengella sediminis TaxID=1885917 RepID=UPI00138A6134|nr:TetR/AcrR family transcriptional regulator [Chengkuizengella sediminis]NDI34981.1 TetR/AcrR family transcriptional regulator [Chengkuizengella sediminis]